MTTSDSTLAFGSVLGFSSNFLDSLDFLSSSLPLFLDYKSSFSYLLFFLFAIKLLYFLLVFFIFFDSCFWSFVFSGVGGFFSYDPCFKSFSFSGVEGFISVDFFFLSFTFSGVVGFVSVYPYFKSFTISDVVGFGYSCFKSFGFSGKIVGAADFLGSLLSGFI